MIGRSAVIEKPPQNPECAEEASRKKGHVPAPAQSHPGHDGGSQNRSNICAGVEDARSQRALVLRKPLGYGFDRSGEVAGFSESEEEACKAELEHGVSQRVSHCGEAPSR